MIDTISTTHGDTVAPRLPRMTASGRLLQRMRAEFIEMPGLMLTLPQATRLWSVTAPQAQAALTELVDAGVLVRDPEGIYRLDDLGLRGRVFHEMFPGTAASDAWRAAFAAAHTLHVVPDAAESGPEPDDPALDEILDETFPASDPPANTVETGIRVDAQPAGGPGGSGFTSR